VAVSLWSVNWKQLRNITVWRIKVATHCQHVRTKLNIRLGSNIFSTLNVMDVKQRLCMQSFLYWFSSVVRQIPRYNLKEAWPTYPQLWRPSAKIISRPPSLRGPQPERSFWVELQDVLIQCSLQNLYSVLVHVTCSFFMHLRCKIRLWHISVTTLSERYPSAILLSPATPLPSLFSFHFLTFRLRCGNNHRLQ
jgi:hypothetical protein